MPVLIANLSLTGVGRSDTTAIESGLSREIAYSGRRRMTEEDDAPQAEPAINVQVR